MTVHGAGIAGPACADAFFRRDPGLGSESFIAVK
jgi:hypothetical protein